MHIRHLEIFNIDKVVPVDVLPVFLADRYYYTAIYPGAFYISHEFPCQSLPLSTTILNDKWLDVFSCLWTIYLHVF